MTNSISEEAMDGAGTQLRDKRQVKLRSRDVEQPSIPRRARVPIHRSRGSPSLRRAQMESREIKSGRLLGDGIKG